MSVKADVQASSKMDTLKLFAAVVMVIVAVAAFYYFSESSLLLRVIGLLAAVGAAAAITLTTELGANLLGFVNDSRSELRKVVWPTRAETLQTSLVVILLVIVMGIFLWLLDMFLFWVVRLLTG